MVILYSSLVEKEGTETVFKKIAPEDWTRVKQNMNKVVKEGREQYMDIKAKLKSILESEFAMPENDDDLESVRV